MSEQAKQARKAAKKAKQQVYDQYGHITGWKLLRIECEVEKLMAQAKVDTGKSLIQLSSSVTNWWPCSGLSPT